jgi:subtilisin family serine protease
MVRQARGRGRDRSAWRPQAFIKHLARAVTEDYPCDVLPSSPSRRHPSPALLAIRIPPSHPCTIHERERERESRRIRNVCRTIAVPFAVILGACADDARTPHPTEPLASTSAQYQQAHGALPRFPELLDHLPPIRIVEPGTQRAAEPGDEELIAEVEAAGGRVMIGLKPPAAARSRETGVIPGIDRATALAGREMIEATGARITQTYRNISAVAAEIDPALAPRLRSLPVVDYLEASIPFSPGQATPPQDTSWGAVKVRANQVWNSLGWQSNRGEHASVTMLDTGLDSIHLWAWAGDGPANVGLDCLYVQGAGTSCYDDYPPPARGHGAHVGGIIAARNNPYGVIGIAHDPVRFASIKVCYPSDGCPPEWIVAGLDWAISSGRSRHIVNMSLQVCTDHTAVSQAVAQAQAAGILLVSIAGNSTYPCAGITWPGRYAAVMAVSGTLENDAFAAAGSPGIPSWCGGGSKFGPEVEISAPFWAYSMSSNGQYNNRCGTSMSAPVVTGVAALVWTRNPGWTAAQVRHRLTTTAIPYAPASQYGAGRVDAMNAVYVPPAMYSASISGPSEVRPYAVCSWNANTDSPDGPFTYSWTVDGAPAGNGPVLYHGAGSTPFSIDLVIVDGMGRNLFAMKQVDVGWSAPECFDH